MTAHYGATDAARSCPGAACRSPVGLELFGRGGLQRASMQASGSGGVRWVGRADDLVMCYVLLSADGMPRAVCRGVLLRAWPGRGARSRMVHRGAADRRFREREHPGRHQLPCRGTSGAALPIDIMDIIARAHPCMPPTPASQGPPRRIAKCVGPPRSPGAALFGGWMEWGPGPCGKSADVNLES